MLNFVIISLSVVLVLASFIVWGVNKFDSFLKRFEFNDNIDE